MAAVMACQKESGTSVDRTFKMMHLPNMLCLHSFHKDHAKPQFRKYEQKMGEPVKWKINGQCHLDVPIPLMELKNFHVDTA